MALTQYARSGKFAYIEQLVADHPKGLPDDWTGQVPQLGSNDNVVRAR